MKTMIPFYCLLALCACNGGAGNNKAADSTVVKQDSTMATPATLKDTVAYTSPLRKGDTLTKGKIYTDTVSYVAYNDNGDNALFVCVKDKDTVALIFNSNNTPALSNGDLVLLQWKMDMYEPAGDPDFPYPTAYLVDFHLLQPGKVTQLKKVYSLLQAHYNDKEVTAEGKDEIDAAVWYYIANTTDTAIRNVIDVEQQALQYTIEVYKGEGDPSVSKIIFGKAGQPVLKQMRFNAEKPYSLF